MPTIVSLEEVKTHLDLGDEHDDELTLLIEDADSRIDDLAGPVMAREVTERIALRSGYGLLASEPLEVLTVAGSNGAALSGWSTDEIGGIGGLHRAAGGVLTTGGYGYEVTVTYVAGRVPDGDQAPARFKRAALRYITWSWRREHGGSETYNPDGEGPGVMGVAGIEKELRFILGSEVRAGRVA